MFLIECYNLSQTLKQGWKKPEMADFVSLTCPSCGGKLQITNDLDRFACAFCGTEHVVRRSGGIVALAPVVEGLKKVQVGVDKTASELAIVRLRKEIDELNQEYAHLAKLKANKARGIKWNCCSGYGCFSLMATAIIISVVASIGQHNWHPILIGLLFGAPFGLGTLAILFAGNTLTVKLANEDFDAKMQASTDSLRQKQAELQQHEAFVSR